MANIGLIMQIGRIICIRIQNIGRRMGRLIQIGRIRCLMVLITGLLMQIISLIEHTILIKMPEIHEHNTKTLPGYIKTLPNAKTMPNHIKPTPNNIKTVPTQWYQHTNYGQGQGQWGANWAGARPRPIYAIQCKYAP